MNSHKHLLFKSKLNGFPKQTLALKQKNEHRPYFVIGFAVISRLKRKNGGVSTKNNYIKTLKKQELIISHNRIGVILLVLNYIYPHLRKIIPW